MSTSVGPRGDGLVVSVLPSYYYGPSSKASEVYNLYSVKRVKRTKINEKESANTFKNFINETLSL